MCVCVWCMRCNRKNYNCRASGARCGLRGRGLLPLRSACACGPEGVCIFGPWPVGLCSGGGGKTRWPVSRAKERRSSTYKRYRSVLGNGLGVDQTIQGAPGESRGKSRRKSATAHARVAAADLFLLTAMEGQPGLHGRGC